MNSATIGPNCLSASDFSFVIDNLQRPECVLCGSSGAVYASDLRSGVLKTAPDGTQTLIGGNPDAPGRFKPNGYVLNRDGSVIFANLGVDGGLWKIGTDGAITPYLMEVDGVAIPTVNFVWMDDLERIWFCVSSMRPRDIPFSTTEADGFIGLIDAKGARIVADGFIWTNECRIDPQGSRFYVNETFGKRTTAFDLDANGDLSNRQTVAEYGAGTFPDGLAFDEEGGLWVVSVVSNRIFRISPEGDVVLLFEDFEPDHVAEVERRLAAGELHSSFVYEPHSSVLLNTSSLAFGGQDRKTVYLGCIAGDKIASFRSPIAGHPPVHWTWA
uniref:SMP-30/gluconolactonase/LRE family protein n=1 Tax=Roseovarius indicus TaxID=540747 RepID=UPI003B52F90F